ncbi:MAG: hypothetical protein IKD08_04395 [Alphaproteobacteria bacterium]|nr:hypothetical protein [Alphaproteobacteria bacterium]
MTQVKMFAPSSDLASKVTFVDDAVNAEALKKAEHLIEEQEAQYPSWLAEDLKALKDAVNEIAKSPETERKPLLKDIFKKSLEIKGQGGTYGHPLLSYVADNICNLLDSLTQVTDEDIEIIRVHIDVLSVIAADKINEETDTPESNQILDGLKEIVQKRLNDLKETA